MADPEYLTVPHLDRIRLRRLFKTITVDKHTGCWIWTGRENGNGYGRTYLNHKQESIHRVMYAWLVGPIPRGLAKDIPQLDHRVCANRACCNPAHLELTSARDNILRSESYCAQMARATHCKRGHALEGWNVMAKNGIYRSCRICQYDSQREYKRRRRRALGMKERGPYKAKPRQHRDS
jgi:hypothetical protein